MRLDIGRIKDRLFNWQAALKSPNFVPLSLKLSILLIFPLVAYFQDFVQVFSLALSDSESQYVLLVPFVAAYFFYRRRKVFFASRKNSRLHDLTGISLCLLALLLYVLGSYSFYALQLHLASLPIFIAGITLLVFGADVLRSLVFPIALLTFLSPFPLFFTDTWGGNLMSSDGTLATLILKPFLPITITYQPIVILTTITSAGAKIQFSLNAACSGIYSLTAFLFCAVVFGYLASGSIFKKVLYGVLAVFAAYFLNVFRITATVVLGHFFGLGLAVDFFHAVGGTVLAFIGTLILLYFGSKVLKLSFTQAKTDVCSFCKDTQSNASKVICFKCGRVLQWSKTKIDWKRMAVVLLFLVVCADLVVEASAVNYNVVANSDQSALNFNPGTGELAALSNATGWYPTFVGRETQAEEQLGLTYVGDYFLSRSNASDSINVIFEISDLQSKFHTWEGCLNYQSYPINIEKITYTTIYDKDNNIVNGEIIVANAPTLNQTLNLVYWYDSLNLKTNGTVTNYSIKITLLKYLANTNNQTNTARVEAATSQLLSLSQNFEDIWSQSKSSNYSFAVDLYRNKQAFEAVVVALLFLSAMALTVKQFMLRTPMPKIGTISDEGEALLKQPENAPLESPGKTTNENASQITGTLPVTAAAVVDSIVVSQIDASAAVVAASKLVFVGVPSSLGAGVTSGAISVQLQDADGNPVKAESAIKVTLSPDGKWFLDADGSTPISNNQVTIDSGSSNSSRFYFKSNVASAVKSQAPTFNINEGNKSSFYFKNQVPSPFSLSASGGNYTSASASLAVNPKQQQSTSIVTEAAPIVSHIVIKPAVASITAGDSQNYSAEAFDQNGKSLGIVTATYSAPDASVTGNSVFATSAGFYWVMGTYAGKYAYATLTVKHASVSSVAITPSGSSVVAGATKSYSATACDMYGNIWNVTSKTVWSINSEAGGTWNNNVYTAAKAGSWTVTGTYDNESCTAVLRVNPAGIDHFVVSPVGSQAAGSAFNLTVSAVDAWDNTVTDYTGVPTLTASSGAINPTGTVAFLGGVWSGLVNMDAAGLNITITVSDGSHFGTSSPFTVNPTLTASAGANGSISPSGTVTVNYGGSQTFFITPDPHYHVVDVLVDGGSVGAVTSYSFDNVVGPHAISVVFAVEAYPITFTQGANGLITGPSSVECGADAAFTIVPSAGYHIVDVVVDGVSKGVVGSFTISDVQAPHSITAVFEVDIFTIEASAGANGAISPGGSVSVNFGGNQTFTFTPDAHHHVVDVLVDGSSVGAVFSYTFTDVSAGHSITVSFAVDTFTITASAGIGGIITPNGSVNLSYGAVQTVTITPEEHYHVADVLVDGNSVGAVTSYSFNNVVAAHTIEATFEVDTFNIIASAGAGGTISPSGFVSVNYGDSQSFTVTANEGYHIVAVVVDSVSQGKVSPQTTSVQAEFTNVHEPHMITAIFAINTYAISASAGAGGTITPSGQVKVKHGSDQSFTIKASAGYHIADVLVDGVSQGTVSPGTTSAQANFANVHAIHTINAVFAPDTP